ELGGQPGLPTRRGPLRDMLAAVGAGMQPAAEVIDAFCDLWPAASLAALESREATTLSWWLPGLCAAADWVGSNTLWFPPEAALPDLATYLHRARGAADRAVREAGLAGSAV